MRHMYDGMALMNKTFRCGYNVLAPYNPLIVAQSDDDDEDLSRPKTPTIHSARSEYDVNVQLAELKKHNAILEKIGRAHV